MLQGEGALSAVCVACNSFNNLFCRNHHRRQSMPRGVGVPDRCDLSGRRCLFFRLFQWQHCTEIEWPFEVKGECALEVFSGTNVVTFGLQMAKVPCIVPWDIDANKHLDV